MRIVSNSGPILSFVRAHRLTLLRDVIEALTIPDAVYEEVVVRGAGKPGVEAVQQSEWIIREHVQDRAFVNQLPHKLHLGEREAIALTKELGGILLVDEREARKEARRVGIDYVGSLRILKEAKDRGIIHEVKPILDELITTGTYMSDLFYQTFLHEIGEM